MHKGDGEEYSPAEAIGNREDVLVLSASLPLLRYYTEYQGLCKDNGNEYQFGYKNVGRTVVFIVRVRRLLVLAS